MHSSSLLKTTSLRTTSSKNKIGVSSLFTQKLKRMFKLRSKKAIQRRCHAQEKLYLLFGKSGWSAGFKLKCNLIKSHIQRIRNFFLFLSIFGEVLLFCKKGKLTTRYKMREVLLIWVFLSKNSSWGWKGFEIGEWLGVMHVRMSHQS